MAEDEPGRVVHGLSVAVATLTGAVLGGLLPGHAGCPDAACLHWGLRRGETYLDPMTLLRPARVRLLPMAWS